MADITVAIYEKAGTQGLRDLAKASGFTEAYLRMFVRTARAFPKGVRRAELSFHLHVTAMHALRRFPKGTAEHSPQFWTDQAAVQSLSAKALHHAMTHHTPVGSTAATRASLAQQRFQVAARDYHALIAQVARFNEVDAVFWGSRVVLVEQPILSPAS